MNLAFFIARRMARSGPENRGGVVERIAVMSVALSMTVMILALAVMMGFKREVARKMAGFAAHATLCDIRSVDAPDAEPVRRTEYIEELARGTEGFVSMAPYAVKGGVVRTDEAVEGLLLKGVDGSYDRSFFDRWLVEGEWPRVGDSVRTKDLLLSRVLAERMALKVGDRVEMLFIEEGARLRRDRFKITGLFASGMDEMDRALAITDLRNVQRLANWETDEISGYEILTCDIDRAGEFAAALRRRLLFDEEDQTANLTVRSVQEQYPHVFDWLKAHDVNAAVVVVIMLVVAFFNVAAALLVLVLERMRMIGLLKALGMRSGMLRRVFLYRAAFVALRGMAWGNGVGLSLCVLQATTHAVKLSSEGYLLSEVPIALGWGWWLALNVGTLAAIVGLLVIPARVVASVKPDRTIRYE